MSDGRRYPVKIEVTETYVVWVEADDAEEAAAQIIRDPEWYELIDDESAIGYAYQASELDECDIHLIDVQHGPNDACRECYSSPIWGPLTRSLSHDPTCPVIVAQQAEWRRQDAERAARRRAGVFN